MNEAFAWQEAHSSGIAVAAKRPTKPALRLIAVSGSSEVGSPP